MGDGARTPEQTTPQSVGLAVAIGLAVVALAGVASEVPLKFDDLNYLTEALRNPNDPLHWRYNPWYMHVRPIPYLLWWGLGPLSLDGSLVRLAQVATWLGTAALLAHLGWREAGWRGLGVALLAFPLCPFALESLDWKSWITSTGGVLGMALGLWELARGERARWGVVAAGAALALGFKEIAAFSLGVTALLAGPGRGVRAVGAIAVAVGLIAALPAQHRLQAWSLETAGFYLFQLHHKAWVVPLAVASLRPRWSPWIGLALGAATLILAPVGGVAVVIALAVLTRRHPGWGLAAGVVWGVVVAGSQRTPVYALEGWLILAALLARDPPRLRPWAWAGVAVLAGVALRPWADHVPGSMARAAEQREFLAGFHPAPAAVIYVGDRQALDLDALVWIRLGAEVRFQPPPGTRPSQFGPRSCVWADPVPLAPGERADAWPPAGRCPAAVGLAQPPERQGR